MVGVDTELDRRDTFQSKRPVVVSISLLLDIASITMLRVVSIPPCDVCDMHSGS